MRDYFRAECAKVPRLKSGDQGGKPPFKSTWPHFESMSFLLHQMTNRVSSGNLNTQPANTSQNDQPPSQPRCPTNFIAEPVDSQTTDMAETSQSLLDDVEVGSNVEQEEEYAESCSTEPRVSIPNRKRKNRAESIGNALIEIENQKLKYLKEKATLPTVSQPTINEDEDRSFFNSLMPHVKKIREDRKLLFRTEIQQVVQRFAYTDQIFHTPSSNSGTGNSGRRNTPLSVITSSPIPYNSMSPIAETGNEEQNNLDFSTTHGLVQESNRVLSGFGPLFTNLS